jgi:tetratricopeptide (TPR) repeat protein
VASEMKAKLFYWVVGCIFVGIGILLIPKILFISGRASAYFKKPQATLLLYNMAGNVKELFSGNIFYRESEFHMHYGILLMSMKEYQQAEILLQKAIFLDPKNVVALDYLGSLNTVLDRHDRAISCYSKIIEISPNSYDAHVHRGFSFMLLDHFVDSRSDFEKALEIRPNSPETLYNLAQVNDHFNMPTPALKYYRLFKNSKSAMKDAQKHTAQRIAVLEAIDPKDIPEPHLVDRTMSLNPNKKMEKGNNEKK